MSNLSDIISGLSTVLEATITGLQTFDFPAASVQQFPAAVILPDTIDPEVAFGGNTFKGTLRVVYLVQSGDEASGFASLYNAVDPTAANVSVVKAVRTDPTLDGKADSAGVIRLENIGRRELWGGYYFGFDAIVEFVKTVA